MSLDVKWMRRPEDYTGEETDDMMSRGKYDELEEKQTSEFPSDEDINTIRFTKYETGMDVRHRNWEKLSDIADSDPDPLLGDFVQAVGESKQLKDVREKLGLKPGDSDKLIKKLRRRLGK